MQHRTTLTVSLLALAMGGAFVSATARRPAAQAAKPAPALAAAAPAPGGTLASLLNGALYPNTMRIEQMTAAYHLVGIADAQGQPATVATKGDTVVLAGETFLVGYTVLTAPPPAAAPPPATPPAEGQSAAPTTPTPPAPDTNAHLTLINMRYVQALGGIRDLPTRAGRPATPTEAP